MIKKTLALMGIFVGSFLFFTKVHTTSQLSKNIIEKKVVAVVSPTPTPIPVGMPKAISIPAIGVQAAIESVGVDGQGRMGIPSNNIDAAWYEYGARPGQKGSAVIDGHFDTQTGAPAVFYYLSKLQNGDTISVTDSLNHTYIFTITSVISYPFDQLPMQQIFASNDTYRLNLITCDGTWDRQNHNYSNREVVYSVLQKST